MTARRCTKCGVEKPATLEYFRKHTSCSLGLNTQCKTCCSDYQKRRVANARLTGNCTVGRAGCLGKPLPGKTRCWACNAKERALAADWRCRNPEKSRETVRECRRRRPDVIVEWRKRNRERLNRKHREWLASSPVAKESVRAKNRAWREKNRDRLAANKHRRRARLLDGVSPGVTSEEWAAIVGRFGGKCAYCGQPGKTRDHVIPLSKGGRDEPSNVVPACRKCNSAKHNRMPVGRWAPCYP